MRKIEETNKNRNATYVRNDYVMTKRKKNSVLEGKRKKMKQSRNNKNTF